MNHKKQELKRKHYMKLEKEYSNLITKKYTMPVTPLKEPYQNGWILKPVLREDFARSSKAEIVQPLIDKFGSNGWTRNPKYVSQIRRKPALEDVRALVRKKEFYYSWPRVRNINQSEYDKLTAQEKKYFTKWEYAEKWKGVEYIFNLPTHYILVKIEKNMVTHKRVMDPDIESRITELRNILIPYWNSKKGSRYGSWDNYFTNRKQRRKSKVELSKYIEE